MKNKKKKIILTILSTLCVAACSVTATALVGCGGNKAPSVTTKIDDGVYYYDAEDVSYLMTIDDDLHFTLIDGETVISGQYTQNGDIYVMTSSDKEVTFNVSVDGTAITITRGANIITLLKKVDYTVSYDTKGGTQIASAKVTNGKKAEKPADPVKDGYAFIGWYKDAGLTAVYSFDEPVTANTTIYAGYAEKVIGQREYAVTYDANYDGAPAIPSTETVGGKVYVLPEPSREGYKFVGWYASQYGSADKLTYRYIAGTTTINENITLYAVWTTDGANTPAVSVTSAGISWDAITGASYTYGVTGPKGYVTIINESVGTNTVDIDFDNAPAGDYVITVTAKVGKKETVATRYYKNKALAKVSDFKVVNGTIVLYNPVENATKYYVTVECGNERHNHTLLDNGKSTYFNFGNCAMPKQGIAITVTATADGYASSVSDTFVVANVLDKVDGFAIDPETATITWNVVENAKAYMVSVNGGEYVYNGSSTSYSLKELGVGEITIKVYPITDGYYTDIEGASAYTYAKNTIKAPVVTGLKEYVLNWAEIDGATTYDVKIGERTYTGITGTSFDLLTAGTLYTDTKYAVSVRAHTANGDSVWGEPTTVYYKTLSNNVAYEDGFVTWDYVIGAEKYEVKMPDGTIIPVLNGTNRCAVSFVGTGVNTIEVCYWNSDDTQKPASEWIGVDVTVYSVTYNARGGEAVDTQYYAVGDTIEYPATTREGYTFNGWYNTPNASKGGGAKVTDAKFSGTDDVILYADWLGTEHTVSYNGYAELATTVNYGEKYTLEIPASDNATKIFDGWFADNKYQERLTNAKGESVTVWDVREDRTVYACFRTILAFEKKVDYSTGKAEEIYVVRAGNEISQVKSVTIPATYNGLPVKEIASYGFKNSINLTSIEIPDTIKYIDTTAFSGCSVLADINVYEVEGNNDALFSSDDGILYYKNELDKSLEIYKVPVAKTGTIAIPSGVTSVPARAFSGCYYIKKIILPATIKDIGTYAFYNCTNLKQVEVLGTGTETWGLSIANDAFYYVDGLITVTLPARTEKISIDAVFRGSTHIEALIFDDANPYFTTKDGVVFNKDGDTILYYPQGKAGAYTIPAGVTTIAKGSFGNDATISYAFTRKLTELTIPYTVTTIEEGAFSRCSSIRKITFKASITGQGSPVTIGNAAFRYCAGLTTLVFENGANIAYIGDKAFYGCISLSGTVEIPATCKYVGDFAFSNSSTLETDYYNEDANKIKELVFKAPKNGADTQGIVIGKGAFFASSSLENLVIEEGRIITSIGEQAFAYAKNLNELTLVSGIKYVGDFAFKADPKKDNRLAKIIIDYDGLTTTFGNDVFSGRKTITDVVIGANAIHVGLGKLFDNITIGTLGVDGNPNYVVEGGILYNADKTEISYFPGSFTGELVIADGTKTITSGLYKNKTGITSVVIPASVTRIEDSAFSGCTGITKVTFLASEENLTVCARAFEGCTSLNSLEIPARVSEWGAGVLVGCVSLTEVTLETGSAALSIESGVIYNADKTEIYDCVTAGERAVVIPEGVTTIGAGLFANSKITSVTIPSTVTTIGDEAFNNCDKLDTVTFANGSVLTTIGEKAFAGSTIKTIAIPDTITTIGAYAFSGCAALTTVGLSVDAPLTAIADFTFETCGLLTEINIPTAVKEIGERAFNDCYALATVNNLENSSVETIGKYAFAMDGGYSKIKYGNKDGNDNYPIMVSWEKMGLSAVKFPKTLKTLGQGAFAYNTRLKTVNFGESAITQLPKYLFEYCAELTEIDIPDGVIETGDNCFYFCVSLTRVGIPETVEVLGKYMFSNCTSLKTVTFNGRNDALIRFPMQCFAYCYALESIDVPDSIEDFYSYSFYRTPSLKHVNFTDNSRAYRFANETFTDAAFEAFTIPASITSVDNTAFNGCTAMRELTIKGTLSDIGGFINKFPNLENIYFEGEDKDKYAFIDGVFYKTTTIVDDEGNERTGKVLTAYKSKEKTHTLLPDVVEIGANAFAGASAYNYESEYRSENSTNPNNFWGVIEQVIVPEDSQLEVIGDMAFRYCGNLRTINFPSSLKKIGRNAFEYCMSLDNVVLPEGISEIGSSAFQACYKLSSINIPSTITALGGSAFNMPNSGSTMGFGSLPGGGAAAMNLPYSVLSTVTFADCNITAINSYTFARTAITEITLPKAIDTIGNNAFAGCSKLVTINGVGVKTVGRNAIFDKCVSLKNVNLPSLTNLGTGTTTNSMFNGCTALEEFTVPAGVTALTGFYKCTSLKKITLVAPENITEIKSYAFRGCTSLVDFTIPENVKSIGMGAFAETGIETATIPAQITAIGESVFEDAKSLKTVTFVDNGVLSVGDNAFAGCEALNSITLPDSVTTIGNNAFEGCSAITTLELPADLTEIGNNAFKDCVALTGMAISEKVSKIGNNPFAGCTAFTTTSLTVSPDNPYYSVGDGWLLGDKGRKVLAAFVGENKNVVMPEAITSIGDFAFAYSDLASIDFGNVTYIGTFSFMSCNALTTLVIPEVITSVGFGTFMNCTALTSVTFQAGEMESIGAYSFAGCTALTTVTFAGLGPQEARMDCAFEDCTNIKSIVIPEGTAFSGAMHGWGADQKVFFKDSVETIFAKEVYGGMYCDYNPFSAWYALSKAQIYFYSETKPAANGFEFEEDEEMMDGYGYYYGAYEDEGADFYHGIYEYKGEYGSDYFIFGNEVTVGGETVVATGEYDYSKAKYWHYNAAGEIEIWEI